MQGAKDTVKIGAVVLASILGIWGASVLITGTSLSGWNTYYLFASFEDAKGLNEKMDVKAAGKNIGYIEWLRYDNATRRALAKVRVSEDVTVYRGSRLLIEQDSLIGEKSLNLEDPPAEVLRTATVEGDTIYGATAPGVEDIIKRADQTLARVDTLLSDDGLGGALKEMTGTINSSLGKVDGVVGQMDTMMAENSAYLRASMQNFQTVSGNFVVLSQDLRATSVALRDLAENPANRENLDAVLLNLNAATASLKATSAQAEALSGDAELQQNIKDTLRLTKETLEETKKTVTQFQTTLGGVDTLLDDAGGLVKGASGTLDTINKFTGGGKGGGKSGSTGSCDDGRGLEASAGFYLRGIDHNANRSADGRDRVVADAKAAIGINGKYLATGVDNIGDGGEINLLLGLGSPVSGGSLRGGVYRGELGAGLAWYGGGFGAEVTAYSPQDPKLDAYGYVPVGDSVDIVIGVEDAAGDAKVTAGAGLKF